MTFARVPETELIMKEVGSVAAFYDAGRDGGPLSPIYGFSCRAFSQLLPKNGTVLDIGCGPARFLSRLLQYRPDLRGIGADMSEQMLTTARTCSQELNVASRIDFVKAEFADIDKAIPGDVDGIVCMSALHHCPDFESLVATLSAIKRLCDRQRTAIWLFDLVRPEISDLCELIPRTHEVSSKELLPDAFKLDWVNSLKAGWTFSEFQEALSAAGLSLRSAHANYSQLHWSGEQQSSETYVEGDSVFDQSDIMKSDRLALTFGVELLANSAADAAK